MNNVKEAFLAAKAAVAKLNPDKANSMVFLPQLRQARSEIANLLMVHARAHGEALTLDISELVKTALFLAYAHDPESKQKYSVWTPLRIALHCWKHEFSKPLSPEAVYLRTLFSLNTEQYILNDVADADEPRTLGRVCSEKGVILRKLSLLLETNRKLQKAFKASSNFVGWPDQLLNLVAKQLLVVVDGEVVLKDLGEAQLVWGGTMVKLLNRLSPKKANGNWFVRAYAKLREWRVGVDDILSPLQLETLSTV